MIARIIILGMSAFLLAGCMTTGPSSVKGGECRIFERPEYAVRGKTRYDQDWVDGNIEAGVGGCGWRRPKTRPASFDATPAQRKATAPPPKKKTVIQRIKDRVAHPFTKQVEPVVESPPVPVVIPRPQPSPSAPPPKPTDPADELLQPSKDQRRFN